MNKDFFALSSEDEAVLELALTWHILCHGPGIIRFEVCNPAEVLGQITRGEVVAPTCDDCHQLLPNEGGNFKRCPCLAKESK